MGNKRSGQRPLPREIKALRGTLKPADAKKRRIEAKTGVMRVPPGTPKEVAAIFRRLVRELAESGILRPIDGEMLLQLAVAVHLHQESAKKLVTEGATRVDNAHDGRQAKHPAFQIWRDSGQVVRSLSAHFGLSPSDRERMTVPDKADNRPLAERLFGNVEEN